MPLFVYIFLGGSILQNCDLQIYLKIYNKKYNLGTYSKFLGKFIQPSQVLFSFIAAFKLDFFMCFLEWKARRETAFPLSSGIEQNSCKSWHKQKSTLPFLTR